MKTRQYKNDVIALYESVGCSNINFLYYNSPSDWETSWDKEGRLTRNVTKMFTNSFQHGLTDIHKKNNIDEYSKHIITWVGHVTTK